MLQSALGMLELLVIVLPHLISPCLPVAVSAQALASSKSLQQCVRAIYMAVILIILRLFSSK